jgi:hypothetical protein
MVTVSLVFSIAAFALFAQSSGIFNPKTSPTPTQPAIPQPTFYYPPTIPPTTRPNTHLTITYIESNRVESNGRATVTLTVTATYQSGNPITLNYSQFYLQLYTPRMVLYLYEGTINYPNHGSVTIGASNPTQTFHLMYEFGTDGFNGMDPAPIKYQLQYNSTATIDWPNQTYH